MLMIRLYAQRKFAAFLKSIAALCFLASIRLQSWRQLFAGLRLWLRRWLWLWCLTRLALMKNSNKTLLAFNFNQSLAERVHGGFSSSSSNLKKSLLEEVQYWEKISSEKQIFLFLALDKISSQPWAKILILFSKFDQG